MLDQRAVEFPALPEQRDIEVDIADPDERPGLDLRAASASGNMPQPRPARTAAAKPSEVGT